MNSIQTLMTIEDVKKLLPGVCERTLRETVRRLGCCSVIGGKLYLRLDDFEKLLAETRATPTQPKRETTYSSFLELSADAALERALALATKSMPNTSKRKPRRGFYDPKSTGPKRRQAED